MAAQPLQVLGLSAFFAPPPPSRRKPISFSIAPFPSPSTPPPPPRSSLVVTRCAARDGKKRHRSPISFALSALKKFSSTELIPVPPETEALGPAFKPSPAVFGVYDKDRVLQFIGITRNFASIVAFYRKTLPDQCCYVKVGILKKPNPSQDNLRKAWKSWIDEHLNKTGMYPPGNAPGNKTWIRKEASPPPPPPPPPSPPSPPPPPPKENLKLTPGRHVKLTVSISELVDRLVKQAKVVAFIEGPRSAPSCGLSRRVVGILLAQRVPFETVDVLDEDHNYGLREALETNGNGSTFPQVYVRGEFLGGCDVISSMAEKGELADFIKK